MKSSTAGIPDLVLDGVTCNCPPRYNKLPLRLFSDAVAFLRSLAGEREIPPDMTVGTYYCPRCKTVVALTARALRLTAEKPSPTV